MEQNKTAIILVGGGMRSAHGAGFLYALAQFGLTHPDIMIGSSGDAGNVAYFCAGQYESLKKIWLTLLSTPKFISLARFWRVMDVDYLIDDVFKIQEPLDVEHLFASTIRWQIPIMDYDIGASRYIGKNDYEDIFETLRAAKAIPFLYGKKIRLHRDRYTDGEFGTILEDHVIKALSLGSKRLLIINHVHPWTPHRKIFARLCYLFAPQGIQDAIVRDISTDITHFDAPKARVLFVNPKHLPTSTATRNSKRLKATFERGVADVLELENELRTLFAL